MSVFGPPRDPGLPEVLREYHVAREAWVAVWCLPVASHPEEWARFDRMTRELVAELAPRGGKWTVGGLTYHMGRKFGVEIEQTAQARDAQVAPAADGHQD